MTVPDGKSLTPEIDSSNGHLMYTFKWDEGKNPEQNDYIVTLTGITIHLPNTVFHRSDQPERWALPDELET